MKDILEQHALWLEDNTKGKRADLRNIDLTYSKLRNMDLRYVDLRNVKLMNVDLSFSDLRGANLRGADVRGSKMTGVNLVYAYLDGIIGLPSVRVSNYQMTLLPGPKIHAGCRWFTIPQAREHWAPENMIAWTVKTPEYGKLQLSSIDFLEEMSKCHLK